MLLIYQKVLRKYPQVHTHTVSSHDTKRSGYLSLEMADDVTRCHKMSAEGSSDSCHPWLKRMGGGMYKCCDIKDTEALRRHELQQTAPEISSALDGPQIESIKMPVAPGVAESGVPEQQPGTETIPNQGSRVLIFLCQIC